ncbi:MAG: DHH family phosphoesterase [Oscillospiraceae bacterium]
MSEKLDLKSCCEILKKMEDILILSHKSPDGDTIGSAFALGEILKLMGKRARIECSDEIPQKYSYFTDELAYESFPPKSIVSVDIADISLFGEKLNQYSQNVDLAIDHHISHRDFAKNTYLNAESAANTENIFEIAQMLDIKINKNIANALFTGLTTDTGGFKYPNTTPKTHIIAAELMKLGAESAMINKLMFDTKTKAKLSLERQVLDNLEYYFDNKCALTVVSKAVMDSSGATSEDFDGISALPRLIEGVEVGITIREKDDGYKLSLRSNDYVDVAKLCGKLGGGGHTRAAGCFIKEDLSKTRDIILKLVEQDLINN